MKQSIIKKFSLLMLGVCLIACMFGAFITLKPTNVNAGTDFVMGYGASVRMDAENYGIKYRAILGSVKDDVTYSMLIIPDDYRTTYSLTEGSDYIDLLDDSNVEYVTMNCKPFVEKDVTYIQGSLTSIKYKNIDRDFFGIAYYTDANGLRTYATFTEGDTTRNIVEVASKAMNNGEADPYGVLPILIKQGINKANGVAEENKNNDVAAFAGSTEEIIVGDNTVLDIGVPAGCDIEVKWSSSDNDVATVDANGKVTAVAYGSAEITATALGQNYIFTNVKVPVSATVNGETITLNGKTGTQWTATIGGEKAKVYGNSFNIFDYAVENATLVAGENEVAVTIANADGASYTHTVELYGLTQANFATTIYNSANCMPSSIVKDSTYYVLTEDISLNSAHVGTIDGTWTANASEYSVQTNAGNTKAFGYSNMFHLFGVFTATLNGNGYSITLDMQDDIGKTSAYPANVWTTCGMFISVMGTIKNLSYYYYENDNGTITQPKGYFCQFLQQNATYGTGTIENCYMKAIVGDTASVYNGFVAHHHKGSVVKNNVFDYKVIATDGSVVNEGGAIGNIAQGATVAENIIIKNSASQADEDGATSYASYAAAIEADNMLDTVSAWDVTSGSITLCNKATNNPIAVGITVQNSTASVSSWMASGWNVYRYNTETSAYDLLTTVSGNNASVDVIAVLESKGLIKAGENTYSEKIKFISMDGALYAEETVELTVTGLNNENFVSLMRAATRDVSTGTFVLIEDVTIGWGAIGTTDGTYMATAAEWNANKAKQYVPADIGFWTIFYAFEEFSGTLNGLGHKLTLDLTGTPSYVGSVWSTKIGGLFTQIVGTVENLNYTYKSTRIGNTNANSNYGFLAGVVASTGVVRNCMLKAEVNLNGFIDGGSLTGMICRVDGNGVSNNIIDFIAYDAENNPVYSQYDAIGGVNKAATTISDIVWIKNGTQEFSVVTSSIDIAITSGYTEYASYDAAISADNMLDDSTVWAIDDAGNLTLCGRAVYTVNA